MTLLDPDPRPRTSGLPPKKRRLLFVAQLLPFPPDTGAHIRTFNVIRQLARHFEVTLICFHRQDDAGGPLNVETRSKGLAPWARVEAFPIPQLDRHWRLLGDHLRSLLTNRVYTWYMYDSAPFERHLTRELESGAYDVVHMDSLDLSRFMPLFDGLPMVLVHHDATSVQLERRGDQEKSPWRRWYLHKQARLMRREERKCTLVSLNVAVSEVDKSILREIAGGGRFTVIPNGVDLEYFQPDWGSDVSGLVFVGGATWLPNRDALDFFCEEILPLVRKSKPDVAVTWVGRATDADRRTYREAHRVELTGYVDDVRPYLRQAACAVIPIRIGSGTRVKILDAWAMGKAVVSTTIGAEGLAATHGEQLLLADSPLEFADAVVGVLEDPARRNKMGRSGRAFVEKHYSWEAIGDAMCREYAGLIPQQPV